MGVIGMPRRARKTTAESVVRHENESSTQDSVLVSVLIGARARAGLTQAQVADRMNMSHAAIAIIESGRVKPTTLVLERYARATGHQLVIDLLPLRGRKKVTCCETQAREH